MKNHKKPFTPKARLLLELGNQLIKDEGIALFELVKNAYDADATLAEVVMRKVDSVDQGEIVIYDDGQGMDVDTVLDVWLEPGTNYRQIQLEEKKRSKKFGRLPLGEKGIGRFGAHKLGSKIQLVSRSKGKDEVVVNIDWADFESDKYLSEIPVTVQERKPEIFLGSATGTKILIKGIWSAWNRGAIRDAHRALNSICSPFDLPDSFKVNLVLEDEDKTDWLDGLASWKTIQNHRLFHAVCTMEKDKLSYKYEFLPWTGMDRVSGRKSTGTLKMSEGIAGSKKATPIDLSTQKIGKITLELDIFDLDNTTLSSIVGIDKTTLKEFLRLNGGIRVYRDNIRVYDYGEYGTDWLELGVRRLNSPGDKISNNIILGQLALSRLGSEDLVEKTNREGFVENEASKLLRKAVMFAITQVESERDKDKERLRNAYNSKKSKTREPVIDDLSDLRQKLQKKKLLKEFGPTLDKIETNFVSIKDKLLSSAGAGLSLSIVIHEIQKVITELRIVVNQEKGNTRAKQLVLHLSELTEGYAMLVRREGKKEFKASDLIKQALFNVDYRLKAHGVKVITDFDTKDFKIRCSRRLIIGALMNLIDNSIWWLENKNPATKYLMLSTSKDLSSGPAIVVGDNGAGFIDDLEYLTQPFFTRKPDGMGLGLHIVEEVMKVHKGKIALPGKGDLKLPKEIDGGVIALVFEKT